jgi:hypothetical protein
MFLAFTALNFGSFQSMGSGGFPDDTGRLRILLQRYAIALSPLCFLVEFIGTTSEQSASHLFSSMGLGPTVPTLILNRSCEILPNRYPINPRADWLRFF